MKNFPDLIRWIDESYASQPPMKWPTYDGGNLDRSQFVTSSEVGYCSRRIKFAKQSNSGGKLKVWGYAERGNIIEEWAVKHLHNYVPENYRLSYTGKNQVSFYHGVQSGTPDGLLTLPNGDTVVLELKSADPRTNYSNLPKPDHIKQLHQNIHLIRECMQYEVVGGIILYIDASNLQMKRQFPIYTDLGVMDSLTRKAEKIMNANSPDDLPAEGMFTIKGCDYCDFKNRCSDMVAAANKEAKEHASVMADAERATKNVFR